MHQRPSHRRLSIVSAQHNLYGVRGQTHRLGQWSLLAGLLGLGALHLVFLVRRVADGTLLNPTVIAEWVVAAGLVAVGVQLHRRGISIFRGRPAAALWIVVALMHGMVALHGAPGLVGVPVADSLPIGASLLVGALAALLGLAASRAATPRLGSGTDLPIVTASLILGPSSTLAARAPPVPA